MAANPKTAQKSGKPREAEALFICKLKPEAKEVYVSGDFNGWNPTEHRMEQCEGQFVKKLKLPRGKYQYKFLIDGEWLADPDRVQVPNEQGTTNNIIQV